MKKIIFKLFSKERLNIFFKSLLKFLIVQNIISLAILPIYSSWGLPFGALSIVGNFVFSIFISIYIFISLIIFFGLIFEFVFYPLIFVLNIITKIWFFVMEKFGTSKLSVYFVDFPFLSYPLCWGLSYLALRYFNFNDKIKYKLILSTFCLIFAIFILKLFYKKNKMNIIEKNNRILVLYNQNNKNYIFDLKKLSKNDIDNLNNKKKIIIVKNGYFMYVLSKDIIKKIGRNILDYYVI